MAAGKRMTYFIGTSGGEADNGLGFATRIAVKAWLCAKRVTFCSLIAMGVASVSVAGQVEVHVVDRAGRPVGEVVVTVVSTDTHRTAAAAASAIMDQRNLAFEPRVLVVAVGTKVEFPNNDTVSHQVYSFSPAKKFQLPLYKGEIHSPVIFDQEGLIVLGCNIHDQMTGYIYVTDTPFFGKTGAGGTLHLAAVPAGEYRVTIWSPFIADAPANLTRSLHVDAQDLAAVSLQLGRDVRSQPEPGPRRGDWEY